MLRRLLQRVRTCKNRLEARDTVRPSGANMPPPTLVCSAACTAPRSPNIIAHGKPQSLHMPARDAPAMSNLPASRGLLPAAASSSSMAAA